VHQRDDACIPTLETCPLYEIKNHKKPVKTLHRHVNNKGEEQSMEIFAAAIEGGESWGKTPIIIEVIRDLAKSVSYSQEQRLTSLGMLASGVAHEIHNPLASIQIAFQSIDQLIESEDPLIDQLKVYITLIEGEIDKCVDITGRLLKLGEIPNTHLQPINVNTVITETLSLLRWEADSKGISMSIDLPKKSPRVMATDSEMRMMILNLVQNAYHAMPDGGDLYVAVSTEGGTKTSHENMMITIKDTGIGIPEDIQDRIFDPFVSHRPDTEEKGAGLGLAITKAIVKRFKGSINVFSQMGDGTCFTVILPDVDVVHYQTVDGANNRLNNENRNNQELL
jgi:signal transduction histidine kinase